MASDPPEFLLVHGTRFPPFRWLHKLFHWRSYRSDLTDERVTKQEFGWTDESVEGSFASSLRESYPVAIIEVIGWEGWNTAGAREHGKVKRWLEQLPAPPSA